MLPEIEGTKLELHNANEISTEQQPLIAYYEQPKPERPKIMYYRENIDEVAAYQFVLCSLETRIPAVEL